MAARDAWTPWTAWMLGAPAVAALLAVLALPAFAQSLCKVRMDVHEAGALADRVWRNESGGDSDKMVWWNPGESFASLGIGHFIWYPEGVDGPFEESFPELLDFLASRGAPMPEWLAAGAPRDCPWPTRAAFMAERRGREAVELEMLLADTLALQVEFMRLRLESALADMLAGMPVDEARILESRFCALAETRTGRYALLDYVNFKGEGTNPKERYRGQGWGVKQVLEEMRGGLPANEDFSAAAARVLVRRVRNAPPERRESRWLTGWLRRVAGYAESP